MGVSDHSKLIFIMLTPTKNELPTEKKKRRKRFRLVTNSADKKKLTVFKFIVHGNKWCINIKQESRKRMQIEQRLLGYCGVRRNVKRDGKNKNK